ncbi:MAG: amidohydrolase family protein [Ignavibacteria bacterium]|nr:amidohydrolase family protein [Ignavibacteria bacterium]
MDSFIIIKNGIVLTLDKQNRAGVYTIVIKNKKIVEIDFENRFEIGKFIERYPQTKLIDAQNKIIVPGFINSNSYSTFSFNKLFFRKCTFETLKENPALQLVDKYLYLVENVKKRKDIFKVNYLKAILAGEVNVIESSGDISFEHLDDVLSGSAITTNIVDYENNKSTNPPLDAKIFSGVRGDEQVNMYLVNNLKNLTNSADVKLFLEVYQNEKDLTEIKDLFRKSLIYVLKDYNLLTHSTILANPIYLSKNEFDVLNSTSTNVVLSPSDIVNFYPRNFDFRNFIYSDLNVSIGTGFTGKNVLSEVKLVATLCSKNIRNYESLLKMITINGAYAQGISSLTGTVEKNKFANLLFFDLNRFDTFASFPEIDSEKVSEYIIENLTNENISDVIVNGSFEIKDYQIELKLDFNPLKTISEISAELYKAGNYLEYAEKQKFSRKQEYVNDEIFDNAYVSGGLEETQRELLVEFGEEFRIVKKEQDDFSQPIDNSFLPGSVNSLSYIDSYDRDFNFLTEEDTKEIHPLVKEGVKFSAKKLSFEEGEESSSEVKEKQKEAGHPKKEEPVPEPKKEVQFKKVKLRFGFGED